MKFYGYGIVNKEGRGYTCHVYLPHDKEEADKDALEADAFLLDAPYRVVELFYKEEA